MKLLFSVIILLELSSLASAELKDLRIMTVALRQSDDQSANQIEHLPAVEADWEQSTMSDEGPNEAREPNPLVLLSVESPSAGAPSAQRLVKRAKVSEPVFSLSANELGSPTGASSASESAASAFPKMLSFSTQTGYGIIGAVVLLMIVVQRRLRIGQ